MGHQRPAWRGALGATAALGALGCGRAGHEPADALGLGRDAAGEAVTPVERCAPPPADATALVVERDVAYATVDGAPLRMRIARPRGGGPRPLVVLLHGGGWEGGDPASMDAELLALARHGYVAASAAYRLVGGGRHRFPAAVQDARCAVRWLRTHAATYDVDPRRVGALGFSAGAHLASLLGVGADVPEVPCAAGEGPAGLRAVVSVAGPQDLRVDGPYTAEQARLVTNFLGAFPGDAPALATRASPIAHVGPTAAPFLLVHGTEDGLVPIRHARRMADALRAAGVPATVLEVRGMGHEFAGASTTGRPRVACTTLAFLDRWLRAGE